MVKSKYIALYICLCLCNCVNAQQPDTLRQKNYKPTLVTIANAAVYTSGLYYLQFVWYKDYQTVPFNLYNDLDGWLQMDKAGHVFSSYFINKNAFHLYRNSGLTAKHALYFSTITAFLYMTTIEIFDGFYEGYGFSASDVVANTIGSTLFIVQQAVLDKEPVKLKFSYKESGYHSYYPPNLGKGGLETFFLDYNGHTYWLSANLKDLGVLNKPNWLNIAMGYSANGMLAEFRNPKFYKRTPIADLPRYRQFFISFDLDCEKIKTKNKSIRAVLYAVNFIKIPLPTLQYNNISGLQWHWFYF
jgi:hypothetical protein